MSHHAYRHVPGLERDAWPVPYDMEPDEFVEVLNGTELPHLARSETAPEELKEEAWREISLRARRANFEPLKFDDEKGKEP